MRLTLRTLLAYLDDTLDPVQTKQIGQKVAESEAARELVAKLKQVARRRRLTAPEVSGKSVDAETVASYLDNTLPPDQVAYFEKLCLESDLHLAEVAACHQILTLILGEPSQVPPLARQRMYGVVKGPEAIPSRRPLAASGPADEDDGHDDADRTLLLSMPSYRHRGTWLHRLAPVAAVLLLLGGLTAALYLSITGRDRPGDPIPVVNRPADDKKPPLPPPDPKRPIEQPIAKPPPVIDSKNAPVVKYVLAQTGWSASRTALHSSPGAVMADAVYDAGLLPLRPMRPAEPVPVTPPSGLRDLIGSHTSPRAEDSLLLRQDSAGHWHFVAPRQPVYSTELLVSLPGYRSEVTLESGRFRLELAGNLPMSGLAEFPPRLVLESAVRLHKNSEVDLDLYLERGRIILTNLAEAGARARLRFRGETWDITFLQPSSTIGLELTSPLVSNSNDWMVWASLRLITTGGAIDLRRGEGSERIPAGKYLRWDDGIPKELIDTLRFPPEWLRKEERKPATPEAKAAQAETRKALARLSNRVTELFKDPASHDKGVAWLQNAFDELLDSPSRTEKRLALYCSGAVDKLDGVVISLDDQDHPLVREAARNTLWHWLGRDADRHKLLQPILENNHYAEEDADALLRLLRGFDDTSETTLNRLIDNLKSKRLVLRELADLNLRERTPKDKHVPFDPTASPERRAKAIELWKKSLLLKEPN